MQGWRLRSSAKAQRLVARGIGSRAAFSRATCSRALGFGATLWAAVCALLLAFAAPASAAPDPSTMEGYGAEISAARVGVNGALTRFVIETDKRITQEIFTLTDDYRLVIDMPEVTWRAGDRAHFAGTGLVASVRYARNRPGFSRLVLDLSGPAAIAQSQWIPPGPDTPNHRFVLDLTASDAGSFARSAGWPARHLLFVQGGETPSATASAAEPTAVSVPTKPRKIRLVIDAGHGGKDPGAIGVGGTYEKDLALKMALALKERFGKKADFEVFLTRESDVFVPLQDRVAFAREKRADLFISVHADSNPSKEVRGASIYTLSEKASDSAAARLARKENAIGDVSGEAITSDVMRVLIELAQRDTMNQSVVFAQTLLATFRSSDVGLLRRTHRFGPFYVLTAADVPSVLLEMGFLSNRLDEKLLKDEAYRDRMADAVVASVEAYFEDRADFGGSRLAQRDARD